MSQVKISACQVRMQQHRQKEDFFQQLYDLLEQTDSDSDYVLFPEMLTLPLLSTFEDFEQSHAPAVERLGEFTEDYRRFFMEQARQRNCCIVAGTHITNTNGVLENTCFVFTADGREFRHVKTHGTRMEKQWNVSEGKKYEAFDAGPARIGITICYENEFPEVGRIYAEQGAEIIFTPTWTTSEHGFWRVRHSAQARCVENQLFLAQCCLVGDSIGPLKGGYGRSAVFTPCDLPWSANGIAAETKTNENTVVTTVVDLEELANNRTRGYVPIYSDYKRRTPIYALHKPFSEKPFGGGRCDVQS